MRRNIGDIGLPDENLEKKCVIEGADQCNGCEVFSKHRTETLQNAESIFDATDDMREFVKKCLKHCSKTVDNRLKK